MVRKYLAAWILAFIVAGVMSSFFGVSGFAQDQESGDSFSPPRYLPPPSPGVVTPNPKWSVGLQIGHTVGFAAQKVAFFGGLLDLGVGFVPTHVAADYIFVFDQDFRPVIMGPSADIRVTRGKLLLCVGGGTEFGKGLTLRAPAKIEYILPRDPFAFFGGALFLFGPFGNSDDDAEIGVDWMAGARLLL